MGDKKKKTFMFIRLVSAAGTGFFYVKRKSAKKVAEKLEFRKYDPRVRDKRCLVPSTIDNGTRENQAGKQIEAKKTVGLFSELGFFICR